MVRIGCRQRPESDAAEVRVTIDERERMQQLCTLIQNEKEQSKLTDLMQELLAILERNSRRHSTDREKENPKL